MVKKRGQADALTGEAWQGWMTHVARVGPAWLFVMFTLCHLLCSRVPEILKLQLQDVDLDNDKITVKPLKKHGSITKPISSTLRRLLDKWKADGGHSITLTRKCGSRGICTFQSTWTFPTEPEQYFFPPMRSDNKLGRMCKDRRGFCKISGLP